MLMGHSGPIVLALVSYRDIDYNGSGCGVMRRPEHQKEINAITNNEHLHRVEPDRNVPRLGADCMSCC